MSNELQTAYDNDPQFRRYVDKYCAKYPGDTIITPPEALRHELVRQVYIDQKKKSRRRE